jgi:hypothetical protein
MFYQRGRGCESRRADGRASSSARYAAGLVTRAVPLNAVAVKVRARRWTCGRRGSGLRRPASEEAVPVRGAWQEPQRASLTAKPRRHGLAMLRNIFFVSQ